MAKNTPGGRLFPATIQRLSEGKRWPKRDGVLQFAREQEGHSYAIQWWSLMRAGGVVPLPLLECVHRYLRDRRTPPWQGGFEDFAERVPETPRLETAANPHSNFWRHGWLRLLGALPDSFSLPQEAHASADDIRDIARMVMENLARKDGEPGDLLRGGERRMGLSHTAYSRWLTEFWEACPECVLYATVPGRGGNSRAGAWVTLPLSEAAYRRFSSGTLAPLELTPADCISPTRWIYPHSVAEMPLARSRPALSRSLLQCGLYQAVRFLVPIGDVMRGATGITTGINPENVERSRRYGFKLTGVTAQGGRLPILELRPPADWPERPPLTERCAYAVMCSLLRIYQEAQADEYEVSDN